MKRGENRNEMSALFVYLNRCIVYRHTLECIYDSVGCFALLILFSGQCEKPTSWDK